MLSCHLSLGWFHSRKKISVKALYILVFLVFIHGSGFMSFLTVGIVKAFFETNTLTFFGPVGFVWIRCTLECFHTSVPEFSNSFGIRKSLP